MLRRAFGSRALFMRHASTNIKKPSSLTYAAPLTKLQLEQQQSTNTADDLPPMDQQAFLSLTRTVLVWATSISIWGFMMYIFGTSAMWWYQADQARKRGIPFQEWVDAQSGDVPLAVSDVTQGQHWSVDIKNSVASSALVAASKQTKEQ